MFEMLGIEKKDFPNMHFPAKGRACDNGLTIPGTSLAFGKAEIFSQD
jgi:hypothetical protein